MAPVDFKVLENIMRMQNQGMPDLLSKLIRLYLENSPKYLKQMREALIARDAAAVEVSAHTLKSSSAALGAMGLMQLCKELEEMGRFGLSEKAEKLVSEIETEYDAVNEFLSGILLES